MCVQAPGQINGWGAFFICFTHRLPYLPDPFSLMPRDPASELTSFLSWGMPFAGKDRMSEGLSSGGVEI
jgi:hypothetical protein